MPRQAYKRLDVDADEVYNSYEIAKLINYIMLDGKKDVARKIVYGMMEDLKKDDADPMKFFHKALSNVSPTTEVRPRRLGGASYLVPVEVRKARKLYLALNWIVDAANSRSNKEFKSYKDKLVAEIRDAANNVGNAVAKKQQTEKMADANKAFAHLKW